MSLVNPSIPPADPRDRRQPANWLALAGWIALAAIAGAVGSLAQGVRRDVLRVDGAVLLQALEEVRHEGKGGGSERSRRGRGKAESWEGPRGGRKAKGRQRREGRVRREGG